MSDIPVIPGYKIERELGQGGMARVYLAHEEKLERNVALKVLLPSLTEIPHATERFIKEAKTAAKLVHPNILVIYDVGHYGNFFYMGVEYLEGGSLKERIAAAAGGLPPGDVLPIIRTIALALDFAHEKGIIHRDIKPDNIMFRKSGEPVLVDFGIAKAIDSATKLTKTGMSLGTPHYMSVEQLRGEDPDGRADFYSLGVVFFEMLTGKVPYDATDTIAVAIKHIQQPVPRLATELNVYQPLIDRLLAKDRAQRFQNGRELAAEIGRLTRTGTASSETRGDAVPDEDDAAFSFARKLNTPEAFRLFLENFPEGSHAVEARVCLSKMKTKGNNLEKKDHAVFEMAANLNSRESYEAYIEQFPNGSYVPEASARISALESEPKRVSAVKRKFEPVAETDEDEIEDELTAEEDQRPCDHYQRPGIVIRDKVVCQGAEKVLVWEDDNWVAEQFPKAKRNKAGFWEMKEFNDTVMIYIPAGKFIMGSDENEAEDEDADEQPAREVWLDGYWIGKYPVTFEQFDLFCERTGLYDRGLIFKKNKPDDNGWGRGNYPVVNITHQEAVLYCDWLDKNSKFTFDLPTEAQWEKAARGTDGRVYPWGDQEPTSKFAQYLACQFCTVPITKLPAGASPYGVMHMAGNVREWCADFYDPGFYKRAEIQNPFNEYISNSHVLRGGAFNSEEDLIRCANRSYGEHSQFSFDTGFRVEMGAK